MSELAFQEIDFNELGEAEASLEPMRAFAHQLLHTLNGYELQKWQLIEAAVAHDVWQDLRSEGQGGPKRYDRNVAERSYRAVEDRVVQAFKAHHDGYPIDLPGVIPAAEDIDGCEDSEQLQGFTEALRAALNAASVLKDPEAALPASISHEKALRVLVDQEGELKHVGGQVGPAGRVLQELNRMAYGDSQVYARSSILGDPQRAVECNLLDGVFQEPQVKAIQARLAFLKLEMIADLFTPRPAQLGGSPDPVEEA